MKRRHLVFTFVLVVLVASAFLGEAQAQFPRRRPRPTPQYPADALPGLTSSQVNAFLVGKDAFNKSQTVTGGLGPIFNGRSCSECHPNAGASIRICHIIGDATPLQVQLGGPLIQLKAIRGFTPEQVPNTIPVSERRALLLQGLGLVGAIPDDLILLEQTWQETNYLGVYAGKARIVTDAVTKQQRVGRLGHKCQHPNATSFAAAAFLRELGMTTPYFPNEEAAYNNPENLVGNPNRRINDDGTSVIRIGNFLDLLAPPPRNFPTDPAALAQIEAGEAIFVDIHCGICHHKAYATGNHPIAALNQQLFYPWSDFLLHDMGSAGDVVAEGIDKDNQPLPASYVRTAPLWGCRLNPTLWHDGRLKQGDYEGAINLHEGQGLPSKVMFQMLTNEQKQALFAFLDSL